LLAYGKPYTQIKIDEICNLGVYYYYYFFIYFVVKAARIRVRSLLAAMQEKEGLRERIKNKKVLEEITDSGNQKIIESKAVIPSVTPQIHDLDNIPRSSNSSSPTLPSLNLSSESPSLSVKVTTPSNLSILNNKLLSSAFSPFLQNSNSVSPNPSQSLTPISALKSFSTSFLSPHFLSSSPSLTGSSPMISSSPSLYSSEIDIFNQLKGVGLSQRFSEKDLKKIKKKQFEEEEGFFLYQFVN
jgi:hypothetical protein